MEIKYELKPVRVEDGDKAIERTVYVLSRCMSMGGFTIDQNVYNQLLEDEKTMFVPKVVNQ